jgi:DNA mismatch repair ATPase MutL
MRDKGKKILNRKNAQKAKKKKEKTKKIFFSSKIYSLIHIDAKNSRYIKPPNSDFLLDNYDYETAIKYDNRDFWRIFYISILEKEYIINIILFKTPMDIRALRICLFIFNYSSDLAFNTIFYNNQNISDKYHYKGDNLFLFAVINNLLESAITTGVGIVLVIVFQHMIDSRRNFEEIFRAEEKKMRNNKIKNSKKI